MAESGIWGLEWLNSNSIRSYPLADSATKLDSTSTLRLPDSIVLSLYFPVNAGVNIRAEKFFIRSFVMFGSGINISLGYDDDTNTDIPAATASIDFLTHTEYKSYLLSGIGIFSDSIGKVVLGRLEDLKSLPAGAYLFSYEGGKLDTDCVRPYIRGVSAITLVNGTDRTARLVGDIEFVAGTNMQISVIPGSPTQIRFDAISGAGLFEDCVCVDDNALSPCIRTINGVSPNANGEFSILTDDSISVQNVTNGIKFKDANSKPCCGCTELEIVTRDLLKLGDAALTLQNYLTKLESGVNGMQAALLSTRLKDTTCNVGKPTGLYYFINKTNSLLATAFPGNGYLHFNNSDITKVTKLFIANIDNSGCSKPGGPLEGFGCVIGDNISLRLEDASIVSTILHMTGSAVKWTYDDEYYMVPVSYVSGHVPPVGKDISISCS